MDNREQNEQEWDKIRAVFLRPPQVADSEDFVQRVMAGLPEAQVKKTWVGLWPRWIFPTFGWAVAGLSIFLAYPRDASLISPDAMDDDPISAVFGAVKP